jgi:hypothetical protein
VMTVTFSCWVMGIAEAVNAAAKVSARPDRVLTTVFTVL